MEWGGGIRCGGRHCALDYVSSLIWVFPTFPNFLESKVLIVWQFVKQLLSKFVILDIKFRFTCDESDFS